MLIVLCLLILVVVILSLVIKRLLKSIKGQNNEVSLLQQLVERYESSGDNRML